jgi:branched-chain amino acid aminotransferase
MATMATTRWAGSSGESLRLTGSREGALEAPPVYVNGAFVPAARAGISVFDHGLLYGDGVFEGIRFFEGRIFELEAHVERFFRSAEAIGLEVPLPPAGVRDAILETAARSGLREGYLRPLLTRGSGDLGLDPRKARHPNFLILCAPLDAFGEAAERGVRLVVSRWRRTPRASLDPNIKSLNYLNNILAKAEASGRGADDALLLDLAGNVAEASGENVFAVRGREVRTPPTDVCLRGITRDRVLRYLSGRYRTLEAELPWPEILDSDEIFLTGTGAGILPVVEIEGHRIGSGRPGPLTREVQAWYRELTHRSGTPIPYRIPSGGPEGSGGGGPNGEIRRKRNHRIRS